MKRTTAFGLVFLLSFLPCAALAAQKTPAAPTTALFYPNEIYLTVEERIAPEAIPGKGRGLVIPLPSGARTDTFSVTVDDTPANGFYWLEDTPPRVRPLLRKPAPDMPVEIAADETDSKRRAMLLSIDSLREEMEKVTADLQAAEARIALWEKAEPRTDKLSPDDMLKLDGAFAEYLPGLHVSRSRNTRLLEELRAQMAQAEDSLREYDAEKAHPTAVIPFNGPDGKTALVRYSYVIPGSCSTSYRVTAFPAKGKVSIEQDAALYQSTGGTWKDVEIFISTTRRDTALRPSVMHPWLITLNTPEPPARPDRVYAVEKMPAPMAQMSNVPLEMMKERKQTVKPVAEEKGTFRLWKLGKRDVDSNVGVTLPLSSDEYDAKYYYTIQPSANPKGFLTADISLEQALELPQGSARFFVDNVAVGAQPMSINGSRAVLFFGTDPQVTATMRDLKRSKGESGFISKEQNVLWHWEITVKNTRSRPVDVRVEDPIPDARDTAVKVTVESKPKPEESTTALQLGATKAYRWSFTLQPGATEKIDHKVQVSAPADKHLSPGRNR